VYHVPTLRAEILTTPLVFVLPWLVVPELTLRPRLRYSLYATFGLGVINISFSVVRFALVEAYGADLVITVALVGKSFVDKFSHKGQ